MSEQPIHRRKFHVFLSHASQDKVELVEELYHWLWHVANIPVWYDRTALSGGSSLNDSIEKAVSKCRAMIIVLSSASVNSPWVKDECVLAQSQRRKYKDFKIIPIRVDDCEIPGLLRDSLHIDMRENRFTSSFYQQLVRAIYPFDPSVELRATSDIYISRTWRSEEATFADHICQIFIQSDFRLIGDSKDHPDYREGEERVRNIISSCGGLLSILPYREDSVESFYTSAFCLDEIAIAHSCGVPSIVIAEPGVQLPNDLQSQINYLYLAKTKDIDDELALSFAVERMRELWKKPPKEHHVFLATSFNSPDAVRIPRQVIQQITGMPCFVGQDVETHDTSIQEKISELIRSASLVIVNTSQNNVNVLIEAGIARGANVNYSIFAQESSEWKREDMPFMLIDKSIKYYKTESEFVGGICRMTYPFRRRVLNYEL